MMPEQGRYIVVDDETIANALDGFPSVHPIDCGCAWCLVEAGQDLGEGSHGICAYHADIQYEQYRASRHAA